MYLAADDKRDFFLCAAGIAWHRCRRFMLLKFVKGIHWLLIISYLIALGWSLRGWLEPGYEVIEVQATTYSIHATEEI